MRIILDAMGGDNAPDANIKGAVNAVNKVKAEIVLVGKEEVIRKKVKEVLRHDVSIDEVKKRLHVPIMLLHECSITKGARELSPEYLEEIKHYHLNRAERFFMSHNNKQKKEGVYGFE